MSNRPADGAPSPHEERQASALAAGFLAWQNAGYIHPLTCSGGGGPGDHTADLTMLHDYGDRIIVTCPTCGFVQQIDAGGNLGLMLAAGPPRNPLEVPHG